MKSTSIRARRTTGDSSDSPTAPVNESQSPEVPHSPLPWRIDDSVADGGVLEITVAADQESIAEVAPFAIGDGVHVADMARGRANAAFIVVAVNNHEALLAALQECSFRLAILIAACGDFTDVNAKALDAATAAIAKAEGR